MRRPRILLVDNDPEYVKTAKEFFELAGYSIVVADNPLDANRIMVEDRISLAILDVRLNDENDEKDFSGLTLAKESNPAVPKVVLTKFPTYQVVRDALGPTPSGPAPAIGFIAKQEGLEALQTLVKLALAEFPPLLERNLLQIFQAPARVALRNRMQQIGVEESSQRVLHTYEKTASELTNYRQQESRRASQLHTAGLAARLLALLLVVISIVLLLEGSVPAGIVSMIASVIANVIQILFSSREDKAHGRVKTYFEQLLDINRIGNIIAICETLESSSDRDTYRKKLIDHIIKEKWLVHSDQDGTR